MPTFALIARLIPVAIGSGEGGVISSTLLTLLVIPTVYDIMSGWRDRAMGLLRRSATGARAARRPEPVSGAEPGMARAAAGPDA
jgi:HAE1 family hydrophobic/amphiphilic exporter-1